MNPAAAITATLDLTRAVTLWGDEAAVAEAADEIGGLTAFLDDVGYTRAAAAIEVLRGDLLRGVDCTPRAAALAAIVGALEGLLATVTAPPPALPGDEFPAGEMVF